MKVVKKNGQLEDFDFLKIKNAVRKSASRVPVDLSEDEYEKLNNIISDKIKSEHIPVSKMHDIVEESLGMINNEVYKEYMSFRDYKKKIYKNA